MPETILIKYFSVPVARQTVLCAHTMVNSTNGMAGTNKYQIKLTLLSALWLAGLTSGGKRFRDSFDYFPEFKIVSDRFGKPRLTLEGNSCPSVSFASSDGRVWGAVCAALYLCGIDAAHPSEFQEGYPLHRVFGQQEFEMALKITQSHPDETASLLWSAKEATVKALGCGFHLCEPLDVSIVPTCASSHYCQFYGQVPLQVRRKMLLPEVNPIIIQSFKHLDTWISIALARSNSQ